MNVYEKTFMQIVHFLFWGLKPPKHKYCPLPNEMKPVSFFGLGLMFFARFASKQISAAGGIVFSLTFYLSPPPKKKLSPSKLFFSTT